MGSDQPNLGLSFADHTPAHSVTLNSFVLDAYETSASRYAQCVRAAACTPAVVGPPCLVTTVPSGDNAPVLCVTWPQASAFCQWDDRRLPTEAEWEFAARGADDRTYPWGNVFACTSAIVGGYTGGPCSANASPIAVDANASGASPEQVFNLSGNVAEWVQDWTGSYPSTAQTDPVGPTSGTTKIVRGGAYSSPIAAAIGYARMPIDPKATGAWGFRCAHDAM
jgi:formylglycine-generating enzyme required for sulfatase activity